MGRRRRPPQPDQGDPTPNHRIVRHVLRIVPIDESMRRHGRINGGDTKGESRAHQPFPATETERSLRGGLRLRTRAARRLSTCAHPARHRSNRERSACGCVWGGTSGTLGSRARSRQGSSEVTEVEPRQSSQWRETSIGFPTTVSSACSCTTSRPQRQPALTAAKTDCDRLGRWA
jgi:hypothetical protein